MIPQTNHGHALLIGVDDYRAYDASGRSDLPGSINDVTAWYQVLVRRGFAPENIRVLASPSPSALGGLTGILPEVMAATKENIERELRSLAERLAYSERSVGFVTFSGHGDIDANGAPVLCPSDTRRQNGDLENVLLVRQVLHSVGKNATLVIDSCHSGFPIDDSRVAGRELPPAGAVMLSLRRPPASAIKVNPYRLRPPEARVFSATGRTSPPARRPTVAFSLERRWPVLDGQRECLVRERRALRVYVHGARLREGGCAVIGVRVGGHLGGGAHQERRAQREAPDDAPAAAHDVAAGAEADAIEPVEESGRARPGLSSGGFHRRGL